MSKLYVNWVILLHSYNAINLNLRVIDISLNIRIENVLEWKIKDRGAYDKENQNRRKDRIKREIDWSCRLLKKPKSSDKNNEERSKKLNTRKRKKG